MQEVMCRNLVGSMIFVVASREDALLTVAIIVFFLCLGAVAYSNRQKGADKARKKVTSPPPRTPLKRCAWRHRRCQKERFEI